MNRLTLILYLIILLFPFTAKADDEDRTLVTFMLRDSYTHEVVADAVIKVYGMDGTLLDTKKSSQKLRQNYNLQYNVGITFPKSCKQIRLVITHDNYESYEDTINSKTSRRQLGFALHTIFLNPKPLKNIKSIDLDEVEIKATKIKMVMKGDTIVYNADAFQLSNGSMLDELIKRLPGVEINGSQITVNGKFVSSLLVNGEDFFKGDPSIALQNLPAYTVKNIKIYEKQSDFDKFVGKKKIKGDNPIVMDVNLKKEYMKGLLSNYEVAIGTHGRWLAKAFAMRYTKNSKIAAYGNLNNINDIQKPGINGQWDPDKLATGETTSKSAGIQYDLSDNLGSFKWNGNTNYQYNKDEIENISASQQFMQSGDTYWRKRYYSLGSKKKLHTYNNIKITLPRFFIRS